MELSVFELDGEVCLYAAGGLLAYLIDPHTPSTWQAIGETIRLIEDRHLADSTQYPYQGIRQVKRYRDLLPRYRLVHLTLAIVFSESKITATLHEPVGPGVQTLLQQVPLPEETQRAMQGETMQRDASKRRGDEAAYRRGWQQGSSEATLIILRLMELGYERRKIRQLLAIYDDHFVSTWRTTGNLEEREPLPPFNVQQLEAIAATHRGYDWLLKD